MSRRKYYSMNGSRMQALFSAFFGFSCMWKNDGIYDKMKLFSGGIKGALGENESTEFRFI